MRKRWVGAVTLVMSAVAMTASPATASRHCNEGVANPSDVSGIPRDIAKATDSQELNALNRGLGSLNQLDGDVPLNAVCQKFDG